MQVIDAASAAHEAALQSTNAELQGLRQWSDRGRSGAAAEAERCDGQDVVEPETDGRDAAERETDRRDADELTMLQHEAWARGLLASVEAVKAELGQSVDAVKAELGPQIEALKAEVGPQIEAVNIAQAQSTAAQATDIDVCMRARMHARIAACAGMHANTRARTGTHAHVRACTRACACMHMRTHMGDSG